MKHKTVIVLLLLLLSSSLSAEEKRKVADSGVLQQAAEDILASPKAGPSAEQSSSTAPGDSAAPEHPADAEPPAGAEPQGLGRELIPVSISPAVPQKGARKPVPPQLLQPYASNSPSQEDMARWSDWRKVSFSGGSFVPERGLDAAMLSSLPALRAGGRSSVYALLLLNEHLSPGLERQLQGLGLRLLGRHDELVKAEIPLGALDALAGMPSVEWVGFARTWQKISTDLQALLDSSSPAVPPELPVTVNLFAPDANGAFRREFERAGAVLGKYDPELLAYRAMASKEAIEAVAELDFVLFIEPIREGSVAHDQSTHTIGVDYIRPGGGGTRFGAAGVPVGILDTGFMVGTAAATMHQDLDKNGCGLNFTSDAAGVWNDEQGHGTHVLATISGTGTADSRFRGVATGVGSLGTSLIRAAKVWDRFGSGIDSWMEDAMDFMDDATACSSPRPLVVNMSGGVPGNSLKGTDSLSRKLDEKVWSYGQLYVIAAGNEGSSAQTVRSPAVAKNALAVGSVQDFGSLTVGDIVGSSSRGPTGDGRMKPNLSAPGEWVTSADAGTTSGYLAFTGTSMAAPHVAGLAATVLDHYPVLQGKPAVTRAYLMANTLQHDDDTSLSQENSYGLGRVSAYLPHWADPGAAGWQSHGSWGSVTSSQYVYWDVTVPSGAGRLVVVMTWDEPAASAGASRAVIYDVDLWIDRGADCTDPLGQCGEYLSISGIDNVEYVIINNPPAGTYRLKATPFDVPSSPALPVGIGAVVVYGDPQPDMNLAASASHTRVAPGNSFTVATTVTNPSFIASGVHLQNTANSSGVSRTNVQTERKDGLTIGFGAVDNLTLGDIIANDSRSASWTFLATSVGTKTMTFRSWSENAGLVERLVNVDVSNFADVLPSYWAFSYIEDIYAAGITQGCALSPRMFCPESFVTRAEMAVFVVKALLGETFSFPTAPYFSDVPSSHWAFKYIQKLRELGITSGYSDGTYKPDNQVTRAETSVFLVRALLGETFSFPASPYFSDVPSGYWAFKYVQKLRELGITSGYGDGTYRPDNPVIRSEMAVFISRTFLGP
jgi:subtilisin family serine protease